MNIKGTVSVSMNEYDNFIKWYMKYSNIRVLKVKDKVSTRYVIDKKDKSHVAYSHSRGYSVTYGIYQDWYDRYMSNNG